MFVANYTVALSCYQKIYRHCSHNGCVNTVLTGRASSTLHVSDNGGTGLHTGSFLNTFCHINGISDSLCIDNDIVLLSALSAFLNIGDNSRLVIVVLLRHQDTLCSVGNSAPQCQISGISSHNLDDRTSLMRRRSITHLVNSFHRRVYRGVKSNRIFCTGNIQIDGSRNTYCIYTQVCQLLCPGKRSVSADNNKPVNSIFLTNRCSLLLSFFC